MRQLKQLRLVVLSRARVAWRVRVWLVQAQCDVNQCAETWRERERKGEREREEEEESKHAHADTRYTLLCSPAASALPHARGVRAARSPPAAASTQISSVRVRVCVCVYVRVCVCVRVCAWTNLLQL